MERALVSLAACACAFAAFGGGYRLPPHPLTHLTNAAPTATSGRLQRLGATANALPAKYDLRDIDGAGTTHLTPVRNQNPYGTCWAHSSMAVLEYLMRHDEGLADADLSENNLANMHGFCADYNDGGNDYMAMAVFLREEGPVAEKVDPYPGKGRSVRERGVRIPRKVVFVPARSSVSDAATLTNDLNVIKSAIMKYGPLSTSYYHAGGYVTGSSYYCPNSKGSNHAVTIVGWDDNYAASKFRSTPKGNGAFIIKNSWGTGYYDKGYLYISYYDANMGFYGQVAYANLSKGDDYGHLYQLDPYGYVYSIGYGTTAAYAMNVFTARADETLTAFGFYAVAENTAYEASVVINPVVSGQLLYGDSETEVGSGTCAEAGYEVIDFSQGVAVGAGTNFAICVKITTPGYGYPVPVMANERFSDGTLYLDKVVAEEGRSYVAEAHYNRWTKKTTWLWEDCCASTGQYFCCKVYAKPVATNATSTSTSVPYSWLDAYSQSRGDNYLDASFYGAYGAMAEHVGANGLSVAASYAKGLDPDNTTTTNLTATITMDENGLPVIGVEPKNSALWSYETLGSADLKTWHAKADGDTFFKVQVKPKK